ncbi:hypothetical protein Godav_022248, partial [Gossypium davidsonii]|nr:hypothetical protein [Gossypium davidsonii]
TKQEVASRRNKTRCHDEQSTSQREESLCPNNATLPRHNDMNLCHDVAMCSSSLPGFFSQLNSILEVLLEKTTFALWRKLKALYMMKSLTNRQQVSVKTSLHVHDGRSLIYGRDNLLFEGMKGNILSNKLDNELGPNKKSDRQASVLVARGRQQSRKSNQSRSRARLKSKNYDK